MNSFAVREHRLGLASVAVVATLLSAMLLGLDSEETSWLIVLTTGLTSIGLTLLAVVKLAGLAWALVTGLVVHSVDALSLTGDDAARLVTYVAAAAALAWFGSRIHAVVRDAA